MLFCNLVKCNSLREVAPTTHDHKFLEKLKCDENTVYVFDKGYNDYKAFKHFTDKKTGFVTRLKDNANYKIAEKRAIFRRDS